MSAKVDILQPSNVRSLLKPVKLFYEEGVKGFGSIYSPATHSDKLKEKFQEGLSLLEEFSKKYEDVYSSVDSARSTKVNPKYVDLGFTRFISKYFNIKLPETDKYGILDLNKVGYKVLAIYTREKGLKNKQFFLLDDELRKIVESPSIEDPTKTYLELTQARVDELNKERDKVTGSCSNIIHHDGQVSMNVSASKILVPKLGLDYSPADAEKYVPQIKSLIDLLSERMEKLKENEN